MSQSSYDPITRAPRLFVGGALAINLAILVAALLVYFATQSQLVLAQGADSVQDIASGVILTITAWVGSQPKDENHPFGHDRAEPLGALITAVLAGVLAFEVLRNAVGALVVGDEPQMTLYVAAVLGGKLALKALLLVAIKLRGRGQRNSTFDALRVDTRNDLVACSNSLAGFGLARAGYLWADAVLAIPVALYIGASGFYLARDNIRFLMGEAPDAEVVEHLRSIAAAQPGVLKLGRLRAQYAGQLLHVEVEIVVATRKSATDAHDIAVAVQHRLEKEAHVGQVFVHVDTHATLEPA